MLLSDCANDVLLDSVVITAAKEYGSSISSEQLSAISHLVIQLGSPDPDSAEKLFERTLVLEIGDEKVERLMGWDSDRSDSVQHTSALKWSTF